VNTFLAIKEFQKRILIVFSAFVLYIVKDRVVGAALR